MTNRPEEQGCLSILFPFLRRKQQTVTYDVTTEEELPYRLRDDFLSLADFFIKYYPLLSEAALPFNSKSGWWIFSLYLGQMRITHISTKYPGGMWIFDLLFIKYETSVGCRVGRYKSPQKRQADAG